MSIALIPLFTTLGGVITYWYTTRKYQPKPSQTPVAKASYPLRHLSEPLPLISSLHKQLNEDIRMANGILSLKAITRSAPAQPTSMHSELAQALKKRREVIATKPF